MPTTFEAKIANTGGPYADGTQQVEINLPKTEAGGLPFRPDEDVPIRLRIAGREYRATLKATTDHYRVWISPTLHDEGGKRLTLGRVLADAGFTNTGSIQLVMPEPVIEVRAVQTSDTAAG